MTATLSFGTKVAFGAGQAAEGMKNAAFGTFLIFYYVQVLGMSGTMAGSAVGLALVVDAFTDPLAGSLSDNWHSPRGRRHPFMYASILPLAISFYLLFNPLVEGETALFVWLVIFTNATRTSMSLYHVPHLALGAEMSTDYDERSTLVSFRMFFLFVLTYFWELPTGSLGLLLVTYPVGVMIGAMFCPMFFRRFGKKAGLIFGGLSWPFWQTLPIVLRLMGWFPENSDALLLPTLMAIRLVQGMCTVQSNVAFGSMVADIADEHELTTGKRQEGIFFAASSFSGKATTGIGNILSGFALDLIDWPRGTAIRSAADIPPETITDLGLVYGPYVAAFGFVSIWCYTHYRLTREEHQRVLEQLAARRAARASATT